MVFFYKGIFNYILKHQSVVFHFRMLGDFIRLRLELITIKPVKIKTRIFFSYLKFEKNYANYIKSMTINLNNSFHLTEKHFQTLKTH